MEGAQGHSDGVSKRLRGLWAWAVSTARKYRNRSGCRGTWRDARDGDLRRWTPVDVLPVVCKQGVRGSSPLSSTGQKRNSNGRSRSTAAKYSNGDRARRRTCVRVGLRPAGGSGLQRSKSRSGLDSEPLSRKSAFGMTPPRLLGGQRAASRICHLKACSCPPRRGSMNRKLFPPLTVRFP
jgi:hypothetical protein